MSSPPYVSILLKQPADGDTVFIRRFTRDPPVRAVWSATAQTFTLLTDVTLTIIGGTYAGTYSAAFLNPVPISTVPGWGVVVGGIFLGTAESPPGTWQLVESNLTSTGFSGTPYAAPAGPASALSFTSVGSPSWIGPTSMGITDTSAPALIIPASLVQAWRPI